MTNWVTIPAIEEKFIIDKKVGVYCIYENGRIVYVGISKNVRKRLSNHGYSKHSIEFERKSLGNKFYSYTHNPNKDLYFKVKYTNNITQAMQLEASLINRLLPIKNAHIPNLLKSDAPLWKFKSCIIGNKLLIQRIK